MTVQTDTATLPPLLEPVVPKLINGAKNDNKGRWLVDLKQRAHVDYCAQGLPMGYPESWRYTKLRNVKKAGYQSIGTVEMPLLPETGFDTKCGIVLVNGLFSAKLSWGLTSLKGVQIESLTKHLNNDPLELASRLGALTPTDKAPMAALNTAEFKDGFVMRVASGAVVKEPIALVCIGHSPETNGAFHARNFIEVGKGAKATLVEYHQGSPSSKKTFANHVTEIFVAPDAHFTHLKKQHENKDSTHISQTQVEVSKNAHYEGFVLMRGGELARHEVNVTLAGAFSSAHVSGAYLVSGTQHNDISVYIDHAAPDTKSDQMIKGVADDQSRAVFQGTALVRRNSQRVDGNQLHKALLLSSKAEIDCKPQLEIYADDVKCTHGATVGALDDNQLFYLQARGIDKPTARSLLIEAFLDDVLIRIENADIRESFITEIRAWLARRSSK